MKSNISMPDRYLRLASGLVLLGCAMGMRRRSVIARSALLGFGAMKVAEGATGWCPLAQLTQTLTGNSNSDQPQQNQPTQSGNPLQAPLMQQAQGGKNEPQSARSNSFEQPYEEGQRQSRPSSREDEPPYPRESNQDSQRKSSHEGSHHRPNHTRSHVARSGEEEHPVQ